MDFFQYIIRTIYYWTYSPLCVRKSHGRIKKNNNNIIPLVLFVQKLIKYITGILLLLKEINYFQGHFKQIKGPFMENSRTYYRSYFGYHHILHVCAEEKI